MRFWLSLLAASLLALLNGCGSSSNDSGNGTIRLVNATNTATYDFYNGTTLLSSGIAPGGVSAYASLAAAVYPFYVYPTGTTATAANGSSRSITAGLPTTLVVYATSGTIITAQLNDNQTAPASGQGLFRIFNTSDEAGAVDVYLTDPSVTDLSTVAPVSTGTIPARLSSYVSSNAGRYRIRVTGTGNVKDVRLDLPSIPLADQEVATLVLTTAAGGTLLNAVNIDQLGATTNYVNPSARLRLVANVSGGGSVAASMNGVALAQTSAGVATAIASPGISDPYQLVPAGALTPVITVNGATVTPTTAFSVTAGSDATLFVGGSATAPTITLTSEDNAVPVSATSTVTTQSKLRLFNGLNGLTTPMNLTVDFTPIASNVPYGTASTSALFTVGSTNTLQATSTGLTAPAYSANQALLASHVYTVFVLGDASSPQPVLRKDR